MVIHLIYQSDAHAGSGRDVDRQILREALAFNSEHAVTGFLVRTGNRFCQHLEGRQSVVVPLFEKIRQDPRHRNVSLVGSWQSEARAFATWSMGYRRFADVLALINQTSPEPSLSHAQLLSQILAQLSKLPEGTPLPEGLRSAKRL